ncbi:MAG: 4-hydroxy-tetrahydrodipicolinate synthase [Ilumatobacteraceae bacterium]|nr:4-hydroxy-tetrahydrodipicolinate synthase [Ilumatobacteraceae bacterium]MBJ7486919.1 4-hydroxy-tetrahydrodipicolinate synthase [Ilumatobacteraceae bacterium]
MAIFGEVLTAMITPFDENGDVNVDEAIRLARWLQANGNDGLVLTGTTGESSTLTDDEKMMLWEAVSAAVTIPVVAGTGSNDTLHSVNLTRQASTLGVAGILAVCPYYNRPSQAGIAAHISAMATATTLPVIVYDIPVRTGRKINTTTLLSLAADNANIRGVKDAAGNPAETAVLMSRAPQGFELYSGDDGLTLAFLAYGGVGVIGVATHWSGIDHKEMITAFKKGDIATAIAINHRLVESFSFETGDEAPNPLPTKAMMQLLGFNVGPARLPMGAPPEFVFEKAKIVLDNLNLARAAAH